MVCSKQIRESIPSALDKEHSKKQSVLLNDIGGICDAPCSCNTYGELLLKVDIGDSETLDAVRDIHNSMYVP